MRFDVVIPTLNSASRVSNEFFKTVIESIYEKIPVDRLIVVDDCSKDKTLQILSEFPNVKFVTGGGSLGKAREIGVSHVSTEWFYFVDDDVILPKGFHNKIMQHTGEPRINIIWPDTRNPSEN